MRLYFLLRYHLRYSFLRFSFSSSSVSSFGLFLSRKSLSSCCVMISRSFCRYNAWCLFRMAFLRRIQDSNIVIFFSLGNFILNRFCRDISLRIDLGAFNLKTGDFLDMRVHFVVAVFSCVHFLFDFS